MSLCRYHLFLLLALAALLGALAPASGHAEPTAATLAPYLTLRDQITDLEKEVRAIEALAKRDDEDKDFAALRARAETAEKDATAAVTKLAAELALVDARVKEVGTAPVEGESPDIARQRATLIAERSAVDAVARRGRLIALEARQEIAELDRSKAEAFNETASSRVHSPITPAFWAAVLKAAPRDIARIERFGTQGWAQLDAEARSATPWPALGGIALALALLFPARRAARAATQRLLIRGAPGHRLRRSANAVQRILIDTAAPLLAAVALAGGLHVADLVPPRWEPVLAALVGAFGYAGFTRAVTGTMLMASQPSWRLAPINDATALRLRPHTWALAALSLVLMPLEAFNTAIGASQAALVATNAARAALLLALLAATLLTLARVRAHRSEAGDGDEAGSLSIVTLAGWIVALFALAALLLGYINLAAFAMELVSWAVVLGCGLYVLLRAIADLCDTAFSREGRLSRRLTHAVGLRPSLVEQIGLLLSGVLRLTVLFIGFALLLTPFGSGGGLGSLFGRVSALVDGFEIGGVAISPGAILRGVVVLLVALAILRAFMRWLDERYLPATDLDSSSRNSISLVTRYVGIALAVIWGLASLGIGVERIAILLSALSVGIGFGLQAITQNFISGLILLAERPIKIGDLVRIGTDEGDVKRISVRSTEIELGDHSTLIVPNSELITKSVLNKTRANPLGRVQIQFSAPIETDVRRVREIVLEAFANEAAIVAEPAANVFIDSITDGRVLFNCIGHVSSPRDAYGTRSRVFLALLGRFHDERIDIGTPPQRLELAGSAPDLSRAEGEDISRPAGTRHSPGSADPS